MGSEIHLNSTEKCEIWRCVFGRPKAFCAFVVARHFPAGQGWDSPVGEGKIAKNSLENIPQKPFRWILFFNQQHKPWKRREVLVLESLILYGTIPG